MIGLFSTWLFSLIVSTQPLEVLVERGDQPLADQTVQLFGIQAGQSRKLMEGTTDRSGVLRFNLADAELDGLAAVVEYEGVTYFSELKIPAAAFSGGLRVKVFPHRAGVEGLRILRNSFSFEWRGSELFVLESFEIENSSSYTLTGKGEEPQRHILRFRLPRSAFNRRLAQGFSAGSVGSDGPETLLLQALAPGRHYFSIQYQIDRPRLSTLLGSRYSLPVDRLEVLLPEEMNWSLSELDFVSEGRKFFGGQWQEIFRVDSPEPGYRFRLSGLPLLMPWTWWLPLVSLGLLFIFSFLFTGPGVSNTLGPKDELLKQLDRLEKLRERALIGLVEYQERRLKLFQRLIPIYESESIKNAES
ncbi:MAG: hypothetical protein EA369_08795 [Bradymonadales bacterium]|nr:MAG: hypothetical protein EA369_08795 [Bradymonadales bacterium]